MKLVLDDDTEIPLTRDAFGYVARHDGTLFHLTETVVGQSLTPAQWVAAHA